MHPDAEHTLWSRRDNADAHPSLFPALDHLPGAPESFYHSYDGIPDLAVDPRQLPTRLNETDERLADHPLRFLIRNASSPLKGETVSVILIPESQGAGSDRGVVVCREEITSRQVGPLLDALDAIGRRFGFDYDAGLAFVSRLLLDAHDECHRYLGNAANSALQKLPLVHQPGRLFALDRILEFWEFVSSMDTLEALVGPGRPLSFLTIPRRARSEVDVKIPKEPSKAAFRAFLLYKTCHTQAEVAQLMSKFLKRNVGQYQVSRWCKKVQVWTEAGNRIPVFGENRSVPAARKPSAMDPRKLDLGVHRDKRARRQRDRPSD